MEEMKMMQDMLHLEGGIPTNADIVMVIDCTGSMEPELDKVKEKAIHFHEELIKELEKAKRKVTRLRIKVIGFRDFYYDGKYAFLESEFFELPDQEAEFAAFVNSLEARGGGDDPECALEALMLAMRSPFIQEGEKKRHIIVLFTDEEAHAFEDFDKISEEAAKYGCCSEMYPANMPKTLSEFINAWEGNTEYAHLLADEEGHVYLGEKDKRMVLFAPDAYPWNELCVDLNYVQRQELVKGGHGEDLDMSEVFILLGRSMVE